MDSHIAFIAAAYAVTAVVIGALVVGAVVDHRAQIRALAELESRGVGRRSSRAAGEPETGGRVPR